MKFPIFKTKIETLTQRFNLIDPKEYREYFELKAGKEIKKLRDYLKENTFIAYLLGKKNSGKGTYSKMFAEIVDPERVDHLSIGDIVREIDKELVDEKRREKFIIFLKRYYRGRFSLEEILSSLERRNTTWLLPTELILALVKREMEKKEKKTLFIDGFPRDLDQISYSLFFRDLIGYRDDPDIFVLIDVPESVIDQRIRWRRVCPICQGSRNLKLFPTSKIGYDQKEKKFYLICENQNCRRVKMVSKEGDELGIDPIRERLKMDERLIEMASSLYGIPKILLRNSIPVKEAKKYIDDYEITPEYHFVFDDISKKVKIIEKPWIIEDDQGISSYSLLPPPVVVSIIKQMVEVLPLK